MRDEARRAVLVVGHGSRREEANDDVREAARRIGERGAFPLIAAAFLEIVQPNIEAGFAQLVHEGARHITVHPYFLSPGRHTRGHIPVAVKGAASLHPGVTYEITAPLSAHPSVIEASVERIRETLPDDIGEIAPSAARRGTVYLVGAGPGDPGLLTLRARDLLASCDVIVYDNLVNPELLRHATRSAERIYVGKIGGGRQIAQDQINRLTVEHAQAGKRVVRLKGGDPFLFGRGGEEAEALFTAHVPFEIVPGVTSALAVPAYAGIPLTHRGLSSSVAVLTGSRAIDGKLDSSSLAQVVRAETVVVLMGATHLPEIANALVTAGRSADTPAAVIRWGTYQGQQTITGTLGTLAACAERAGIRAPSVIVVGEVVGLRERLKWFEKCGARVGDAELESVFAGS